MADYNPSPSAPPAHYPAPSAPPVQHGELSLFDNTYSLSLCLSLQSTLALLPTLRSPNSHTVLLAISLAQGIIISQCPAINNLRLATSLLLCTILLLIVQSQLYVHNQLSPLSVPPSPPPICGCLSLQCSAAALCLDSLPSSLAWR